MIWEPFVLALFLGLIVSAGLYFAYLWPSVEPVEPGEPREPVEPVAAAASPSEPAAEPVHSDDETDKPTDASDDEPGSGEASPSP